MKRKWWGQKGMHTFILPGIRESSLFTKTWKFYTMFICVGVRTKFSFLLFILFFFLTPPTGYLCVDDHWHTMPVIEALSCSSKCEAMLFQLCNQTLVIKQSEQQMRPLSSSSFSCCFGLWRRRGTRNIACCFFSSFVFIAFIHSFAVSPQ